MKTFFYKLLITHRVTHLQHTPFTYIIQINNKREIGVKGTCRIFMSPKFDERHKSMAFRDQRLLMTEMDKFVVTCKFNLKIKKKPIMNNIISIKVTPGQNTILRQSTESSVTIPFERTFLDVDEKHQNEDEEEQFNFCGCGWSNYLLKNMNYNFIELQRTTLRS